MENISKADALGLVSKWERQNHSISVFCFNSMIALISKSGRVVLCLDDCINLSLADESELQIFTSEAVFARVGREDFPMDCVDEIPEFQQAICIDFPGKQMQWYRNLVPKQFAWEQTAARVRLSLFSELDRV